MRGREGTGNGEGMGQECCWSRQSQIQFRQCASRGAAGALDEKKGAPAATGAAAGAAGVRRAMGAPAAASGGERTARHGLPLPRRPMRRPSKVDEAELAVVHALGLRAAAHLLKRAPVGRVAHRHHHALRPLLQPAAEGTDARLPSGVGGVGRRGRRVRGRVGSSAGGARPAGRRSGTCSGEWCRVYPAAQARAHHEGLLGLVRPKAALQRAVGLVGGCAGVPPALGQARHGGRQLREAAAQLAGGVPHIAAGGHLAAGGGMRQTRQRRVAERPCRSSPEARQWFP